jgi:phosphoglycolate phosphatase/putative hydrolase of the HAD superfamily
MKLFASGGSPSALVFDLDNTLYTNPAYAAFQEDALVERLGRELGIGPGEAAARISALRDERIAAGLGKTSLGRLFAALGVDIATSVRWREECFEPSRWLVADSRLDLTLGRLAVQFDLALLTNNPRLVGEKSLDALGVRSRFSVILGLDDTLSGKPATAPFVEVARRLGRDPRDCISIGDRFDVDLAPAMDIGMGAVLVDGVEDVYHLPELFAERRSVPGSSQA